MNSTTTAMERIKTLKVKNNANAIYLVRVYFCKELDEYMNTFNSYDEKDIDNDIKTFQTMIVCIIDKDDEHETRI